jgi:hypothetical protein
MVASRIRRRWARRAIALLIVVNTAIWASFALAGRHSRAVSAVHAPARSTATH